MKFAGDKPGKRCAGWVAAGLACALLSSGCSHNETLIKEARKPVVPEVLYPKDAANNEGSLWKGEAYQNMFGEDPKAKRVGDVITIVLSENLSSTSGASTSSANDVSMNLQTGRMLGLPGNLGIENFLGSGAGFNPNLDAKSTRSHKGDGTTKRTGILTGTISAIVTEVFPNGNIRIEGKRIIGVNNEEQVLIIKGIVRPADISFTNSVKSTQIAEMDIAYSGQGVVSDDQRVGWGYKILSWIWPF